jgi:hypothetical protein
MTKTKNPKRKNSIFDILRWCFTIMCFCGIIGGLKNIMFLSIIGGIGLIAYLVTCGIENSVNCRENKK